MVFTGFVKPQTVGKVNTPTFSFFGLAAVMNALSFDVANTLSYRDLVGFAGAYSADRKPTGSSTMELPTIAAANFGEMARLGTDGALQLIHGIGVGNIIQIDMPKVQLTSAPAISNDNEVAMLQVGFSVKPNLGNDELVIVAK